MTERSASDDGAPARVLVIGLDMGDGELLQCLSRAGELPNFAKFLSAGSWCELASPAEILHTSTWPTFATGAEPGAHGVYYPVQPRPGHQRAQHVDAGQYGAATFWAQADRQGRRCLVCDVPETFPEQGFGGRAIFEWGTWAWYGSRCSQPASLLEALEARFGPYPLKLEATRLGLKFPDPESLERQLVSGIEHKTKSLQWLLANEDWDLAVVGFCETHPTGHYLWPRDGTAPEAREGSAFASVRRVYAALDRALGALAEAVPAGTAVLIVSGDGVRPNHCGWHLLPDMLERMGYAVAPSSQGEGSPGRLLSLRGLKNAVPAGLRRWIADHLPSEVREKINAGIEASALDWSKTRAFALPTDLEGYIRINLKGREPEGIVEPGSEYTALCREIASRLERVTNDATGRPAVDRVWIRDEVFPGPAREHLPDLIVTWKGEAPITAISEPQMGSLERASPDPRTGTHSPSAFALAFGSGVPSGERGRGRLVDVAATVLGLLDVPRPDAMAGKPLWEKVGRQP